MKKKTVSISKLSLRKDTITLLDNAGKGQVLGADYTTMAGSTCDLSCHNQCTVDGTIVVPRTTAQCG